MRCCSLPEVYPAIYYGDEQGFTGKGGDAASREDMFGSKVPAYAQEKRIGGGDGSAPAFNEDHPLFRAIRTMISVRKKNPTLQGGIQVVRYAEDKPGIFAVSRIDPKRREEMLVIFNNSAETQKVDIKVFSPAGNWERVFDSGAKGISFGPGPNNALSIELAPWSVLVLRNPQSIQSGIEQPGELRLKANRHSEVDERWEIVAEPTSERADVGCVRRARKRGDELQISRDLGFAAVPSFSDLGRRTQCARTRIQGCGAGFVRRGTDGGI